MSGVVSSVNGRDGAVKINRSDVVNALGFTPYNNTNPDKYVNSSTAPVRSVAGFTGDISESQIARALDFIIRHQSVAHVKDTTNVVLTASQMIKGFIIRTGPDSAFTDKIDTAANLVDGYADAVNGSSFITVINNSSSHQLTLSPDTGVTLVGSPVIAGTNSVLFLCVIEDITSGSESVTITRMLSGGI